MKASQDSFQVGVLGKRWLTEHVFELSLERPEGFSFIPGQKVRLSLHGITREYTLINPSDAVELTFCIRYVADGRLSPLLVKAGAGELVTLSAATGFFIYQSLGRRSVFVATGTGIAPFLAFIRDGARDFYCLQGASSESELLYRDEIKTATRQYIPCLSVLEGNGQFWRGRVTAYLEKSLKKENFDFYLCGKGEMVRDAIRIIDLKFPGSRVFMETFF
jgi:benzoate/toluate 1,2-dioxygenase reductase component